MIYLTAHVCPTGSLIAHFLCNLYLSHDFVTNQRAVCPILAALFFLICIIFATFAPTHFFVSHLRAAAKIEADVDIVATQPTHCYAVRALVTVTRLVNILLRLLSLIKYR
jgi:hypothetical protein